MISGLIIQLGALERIGGRFATFVNKYSHHFHVYRKDLNDKARQYASGLMQAGSRKNMDRMAEVVPDAKSRNLQQFITHCNWSARDVIDDVAKDVNALLRVEGRTTPSH